MRHYATSAGYSSMNHYSASASHLRVVREVEVLVGIGRQAERRILLLLLLRRGRWRLPVVVVLRRHVALLLLVFITPCLPLPFPLPVLAQVVILTHVLLDLVPRVAEALETTA